MRTVLVGIDTGGTFTDLVAVEVEKRRYHYHKVPTTTVDPAHVTQEGNLDVPVEVPTGSVEDIVLPNPAPRGDC